MRSVQRRSQNVLKRQPRGPADVIGIMVGDLQRLKLYPALGYLIAQEIPDEVWSAYEGLVRAGFDKYLIESVPPAVAGGSGSTEVKEM